MEFFGYKISAKKIIAGVAVLIILVICLSSFEVVDEGERGLLFTFGKVEQTILMPGLTWKKPFIQTIRTYTVQPIEIKTEIEVGSGGAITKDNQTVGALVTAYYKYKEDQLVVMYSKTGPDKLRSIFDKTILESFKSIIGTYDIFNLAQNRDRVSGQVFGLVKQKMADYPAILTEIKITNFDWSDEFDKQIETTMRRAQEVKQKAQELLISEQEAQKKVKQAEANREAAVQEATGEKEAAALKAEAKRLNGQGIKAYNEAIRSNLDIELAFRKLEIEKIKAEKWNGQYVPNNMYGPIPVDTKGGVQGR